VESVRSDQNCRRTIGKRFLFIQLEKTCNRSNLAQKNRALRRQQAKSYNKCTDKILSDFIRLKKLTKCFSLSIKTIKNNKLRRLLKKQAVGDEGVKNRECI
jgi:hypothetical protein